MLNLALTINCLKFLDFVLEFFFPRLFGIHSVFGEYLLRWFLNLWTYWGFPFVVLGLFLINLRMEGWGTSSCKSVIKQKCCVLVWCVLVCWEVGRHTPLVTGRVVWWCKRGEWSGDVAVVLVCVCVCVCVGVLGRGEAYTLVCVCVSVCECCGEEGIHHLPHLMCWCVLVCVGVWLCVVVCGCVCCCCWFFSMCNLSDFTSCVCVCCCCCVPVWMCECVIAWLCGQSHTHTRTHTHTHTHLLCNAFFSFLIFSCVWNP